MPERWLTIDPYKVLQVDSEAEDEVIQAAYRRLARKYHPDLAATPEAAARMAAINAAWELIGDPADAAGVRPRARALDATPASGGGVEPRRRAARRRGRRPPPPGADRSSGAATTAAAPPPPEIVSRDWTSGRSTQGGGYDESMRAAEGLGAAGPPPGRPSGTVLNFGRYAGWSLGEVARHDLEYIEWLDRAPIGRNYRAGDRRDPAHERAGGESADARARRTGAGLPPALARRASAGGAAPAPRLGVPVGRRSVGRIVRSTTQPDVVPWTSSVNRTTPKVISWSSARCGMSAGSDSAIATATAPRRPAQNRTWSQPRGTRLGQPRAARQPRRPAEQDVDHDRPADEDADDRPGDRAERLDEAARRDRQPDQQEDDRRQQVGDELPDGVDRVRAGRRSSSGRDRRCRARWRP